MREGGIILWRCRYSDVLLNKEESERKVIREGWSGGVEGRGGGKSGEAVLRGEGGGRGRRWSVGVF